MQGRQIRRVPRILRVSARAISDEILVAARFGSYIQCGDAHLIVSAAVLAKIRDKHNVTVREVEQCFENQVGLYLEEERPAHHTDPQRFGLSH